MRQYYLFELKAFFYSKKNLAIIILLILSALYYSLLVAPQYQPNEAVDEEAIRAEHDAMVYWIDNQRGEGISSGASFALAYYPELIDIDANRLNALASKDYEEYAEWTADWYLYQDDYTYNYAEFLSYNHVYYGSVQDYPAQEGSYWYRETANRYQAYIEEDITITESVLEERTALQTLYRMLNNPVVPALLIGAIIFFSNDSVVKDRKHLTIVRSFPLTLAGKLWTKTFVLLTAISIVFVSLTAIILLLVGIQQGLGSFSVPVTVFDGRVLESGGAFNHMSLGMFFLQAGVLLLLIGYLFIRGIMLFSLIVRNEFFNILAGLALLFTERLYYIRGVGFFSNVDVLPPTFFPIGQVLSGYQNHLYNSPAITFRNGVYSIVLAAIIVELLLFLTTRFKPVREFI